MTLTYYGLPALKPAGFDWKVGLYIAAIGAGGAAQVLAGVSRLEGRGDQDGLASRARGFALASSIVAPAVLIGHLKTPQRWYNMLRIVRPQSPMSLGSWLLAGFGAASFAAVAAEQLGWRRVADAAQVPASLTGAAMASYTAALLSATSNPVWAAAPGAMAVQFSAASFASGASALALIQRAAGEAGSARRLETVAAAALVAEAAASVVLGRQRKARGANGPLEGAERPAMTKLAAEALGVAAPLLLRALGRPVAASALTVLGSALLRNATLDAGDEIATRPRATLGFASAVPETRR